MLLFLIIISLSLAQNLYGPSQLDQYTRLLNSGNLGGFGFFQHALTEGTVRSLGDLNTPPLIVGLPPLPLTYEEVMKQLTSTPQAPITRATAIPTTPSTNPGGIYAVNTMVELPPMPESRIHGTFDDDGVFHPDNEAENIKQLHIIRNQIQGTKIRDFSHAERDAVENHLQENTNKVVEYEDDATDDDLTLHVASDTKSHQLAQHSEKTRRPRQNPSVDRQRSRHRQMKYHDKFIRHSAATVNYGDVKSDVTHIEYYPPFIFRPRPPPPQREPEYNNLLAEIEEYDDFLEEERLYRSRYPQASLPNPYRDLPPGQLPSAGAYSAANHVGLPPPGRTPMRTYSKPTSPQLLLPLSVTQQSDSLVGHPSSSNQNTLHNIFNLFSFPHAHALAAPQVKFDIKALETTTVPVPSPRPNPYQFGVLPLPMQAIPLVDIQQQPLSFPQPDSPLVLAPLFRHGK
ncbi:hypothetical protein KIN20_008227 [Parelaphostrongylus tenuis]|uniref:Uncharacterized protein n=1 Tax=Parelaphostrongylus tenuis TaxID=148309 RepID=A0AAD5M6J4_PARTN|nr:hypothetical protein KIN20_008227 [Parelaphostrongylus tenuis]